jgi:hypothetical protein
MESLCEYQHCTGLWQSGSDRKFTSALQNLLSCLPLRNFSSEIFSMAFRKQSSKKHLKAREQGYVAKDK